MDPLYVALFMQYLGADDFDAATTRTRRRRRTRKLRRQAVSTSRLHDEARW